MIYTIATAKGGTAKTTTAAAIAQAAAYTGRRALAIDLDPQGNLTFATAADARQPGSYELLHGTPARDLLQHSPQGIDVIPASRNLQTETSGKGTARRLQKALAPIRDDYDVITIDTPATAGELQYNALQAADRLIIVLEADAYSAQALYQIAEAAEQIKQGNPHLQYAGVLIVNYYSNPANIDKFWRQEIEQTGAALHIPYLGEIRHARKPIKEAVSFQQSLFEYAPKSNPAADYLRVFEAITQ